jgi:hypothetical protein
MLLLSTQIRLGLYTWGTVMAEDIDTQINGMTVVLWPSEAQAEVLALNSSMIHDIKARVREQREISRLIGSIPVRLSAAHVCLLTNDPVYQLLKAFLLTCAPKAVMCRMRIHLGTT